MPFLSVPFLCHAPSVLCCAGARGGSRGGGREAASALAPGTGCISQTWQEPGEGASRAAPAGVGTSLWVGELSFGSGLSSWSVETWQSGPSWPRTLRSAYPV